MISMGVLFRLFLALTSILSYLLWPIFDLFAEKKRRLIPKTNNPLFTYSASELARKIRTKQISSEELVLTFVHRIAEINPILNAVVEARFAMALEEAKLCDRTLHQYTQHQLETEKPLFGVPVTIKENLSVKGCSYTVGAIKRKRLRAQEDGDCVAKIKAAGAIPLCVTNTPEYCLSIETFNLVTGPTSNPYNTLHNSGGSSGGEGALIGSGASVCGLGSDIAGSIRIPSAFNGIFGHKLSPGLVSLKGHIPMSSDPRFSEHLTIGPMARYSEDLPLITKIIAGENAKKLNLDEPVNLGKLKVIFMEECGSKFSLVNVEEEIKCAIRSSVEHLRDVYGSEISDVKFKEMEYSAEWGTALHFSLNVAEYALQNAKIFDEIMNCLFGQAKFSFNLLLYGIVDRNSKLLLGNIEDYEKEVTAFKDKIVNKLGNNGVFLYPSFPTSAILHKGSMYASIGAMYLLIVNVLGLPATNVPVGVDKKGLPIGIQVIAAPNQDRLCFAVARELETVFGGWKPPY